MGHNSITIIILKHVYRYISTGRGDLTGEHFTLQKLLFYFEGNVISIKLSLRGNRLSIFYFKRNGYSRRASLHLIRNIISDSICNFIFFTPLLMNKVFVRWRGSCSGPYFCCHVSAESISEWELLRKLLFTYVVTHNSRPALVSNAACWERRRIRKVRKSTVAVGPFITIEQVVCYRAAVHS